MKVLWFFLLVTVCVLAAATQDTDSKASKKKKAKGIKIKEEKGVLELNKNNFEQAIKQHKHLLVNFHAPLSGESQGLTREFTSAAAQLRNESSTIRLGTIDVSKEKDLTKELNVTDYPALKFFISGDKEHPIICPVLRTASSIITWLKRRTGHSAEHIKDSRQAEIFVKVEDVVILGFFKDLEEEAVKVFYEAAMDIPDLPFGVTKNKNVFNKFNVTKDIVLLFKKFEKFADYEISSETTKESLMKFIRVYEMDLVTEYNRETSIKVFGSLVTTHILLFANKSAEDFGDLYETFESTAAEFRGKLLFILIDTDESRNGRIFEYFQVRDVDTPAVRLLNLTDNMQYQMPADEVTVRNVRDFCQDFFAGKAKPKLDSQPIPENWDKQPVKELVGLNFERVAFNDERNVFVMFYKPWSQECKDLFPVWEKVGKVYENHESVVIARIDSTANDVHTLLHERNPMFKFFPAVYGEKVVPYSGKRTLEDFVQFVESEVELAKEEKAKEEVERKKIAEAEKAKEKEKKEEL
ncbi:protein disulfide-isomerase [Amia ocellicauda]|uniref:protein disulfide-isomerase n=1 Tax=Amia ocellicauda TaxID=2972642 RepID=UPI00346485E1